MDETINIQTNETDYDKKQAKAARDILNSSPNTRRLVVGSIAVGGALAALLAGQIAQNENTHNERTTSIHAEYQNDQNIKQEIDDKALAPVNPASIVGLFNITPGSTINGKSIEIIYSLDFYKNSNQKSKDFINYTIYESGLALGTFQPEESYVVTEGQIDGKETLLVQKNDGIQTGTIPAPITH